jgi:hypothetical protein
MQTGHPDPQRLGDKTELDRVCIEAPPGGWRLNRQRGLVGAVKQPLAQHAVGVLEGHRDRIRSVRSDSEDRHGLGQHPRQSQPSLQVLQPRRDPGDVLLLSQRIPSSARLMGRGYESGPTTNRPCAIAAARWLR